MKSKTSIKLITIFIILLIGCQERVETETDENQVLFFHAYHGTSYWDKSTNIFVDQESTSGWGVLLTDSTPIFDYFKMGNVAFADSGYVKLFEGYISFGDYDFDGNAIITEDYDPLDVEVQTSIGKIYGSITFPSYIQALYLSHIDSLSIGEPFTVSWSGSNADFYNVSCHYRWIDENGNLGTTYFNDFTSDSSFTFPGSNFHLNGEISFIYIIPQNGPLPDGNSDGNMSGDGNGFLYYSVRGIGYTDGNIKVGTGTGLGNISQSTFEILAKEQLDKNRAKLEKKIRENRVKKQEL